MSKEQLQQRDPRIERAVEELEGMIRRRYPAATFEVAPGEDPEGVYLWTTVDLEDTDPVLDVVMDRLLELEVDEGLPKDSGLARPAVRMNSAAS